MLVVSGELGGNTDLSVLCVWWSEYRGGEGWGSVAGRRPPALIRFELAARCSGEQSSPTPGQLLHSQRVQHLPSLHASTLSAVALTMSLTYGLGGSAAALGVVGLCKSRRINGYPVHC